MLQVAWVFGLSVHINGMKPVLRIGKKLKTPEALRAVNVHNSRILDVPNVDPNRTNLNECFVGSNVELDVLERIEKLGVKLQNRKSGQVLAFEVFLSASPSYFFPNGRDHGLDESRLNAWFEKTRDWIKTQFTKEQIATVHMHLDESTPHIHLVVCPVVRKARKPRAGQKRPPKKRWVLDAKTVMGNPRDFHERQKSYAAAVAPLGISSPNHGNQARHEPPSMIAKRMAQKERDIDESIELFEVFKSRIRKIEHLIDGFESYLSEDWKVKLRRIRGIVSILPTRDRGR